jgi:hypothetical protein
VLLRSVLRSKPHLRDCLARCRHCGIFFLTHPGNGGRKDLRCPFGCQKAHYQRQSNLRSLAYYGTPEGKKKKSDLNQKRGRPKSGGQPPPAPPPARVAVTGSSSAPCDPLLLEYVRMVVILIEGRAVSRAEILEMLRKDLRQRSPPKRRKSDQTVAWLHEHPP